MLLRIITLVCLRTSSLHFSPRKKVGLDHALHLEYPIQNETRHPISYSSKGCSPRGYARYLLLTSDIVHSFSTVSLDLVLMDHSHGAVMIDRLILATYLYRQLENSDSTVLLLFELEFIFTFSRVLYL